MNKGLSEKRFDTYLVKLCAVVGHADRNASLRGYCSGLLMPLDRKSIEPLAAHLDPRHVRARHQSLHHFVAKSDWSDAAVLAQVRDHVLEHMDVHEGVYWIVDDTAFRKKGRHSVGVARQYCGEIGKQDNCQAAVSLSLATAAGSIPMAWQLYLPKEWVDDPERCQSAGVPSEVVFATKPQISLAQLQRAVTDGVVPGVVLADAAYGTHNEWRAGVAALSLQYAVGVISSVSVWPPGVEPQPPAERRGRGRPPVRHLRTADRQPMSVEALARSLPEKDWSTVQWRQGSNAPLSSRFAALRVRPAQGDRLRDHEWLLIEWPLGESGPTRYFLSNLPEDTSKQSLVHTAKARWRIERDYQELKQEFGLDHYEGRGWRGFHHHATLCIATYGFFVSERLRGDTRQKKPSERPKPVVPKDYRPRGSTPARSTTRA
jgi:SRSO17 transposase